MVPRLHPSAVHFVNLPTTREAISHLVHSCNELLKTPHITTDESRKIALDLCTAASMLLIEPNPSTPDRLSRNSMSRHVFSSFAQTLTETPSSQCARRNANAHGKMPPRFTSVPRPHAPIVPRVSPFSDPPCSMVPARVIQAQVQHVQMLLQCFTLLLTQNCVLREFLIAQRNLFGFGPGSMDRTNILRNASLKSFSNLSEFGTNYFDHLIYENQILNQSLNKRMLALQTFLNELKQRVQQLSNIGSSSPNTFPLRSSNRNFSRRPKVQPPPLKIACTAENFAEIASKAEGTLRDHANAVLTSIRCGISPAEAECDAMTIEPASNASHLAYNSRVNMQGTPMLQSLPAPPSARLIADPIPDWDLLTQANYSPVVSWKDVEAIHRRRGAAPPSST